MEAKLLREQLDCRTLVYSEKQTREETAETVVPDTMPDIAELLDADAEVFLRSKEIAEGKVCLDGQIRGTVLYASEEKESVQKIEMTVPCSFRFDADETQDTDALIATLRVISADARALNPRKILLRVDVRCDAAAYREDSLSVTAGAEEDESLQTLVREETITYTSAVAEKTFVVSEELAFSAGSPVIGELLRAHGEAMVEDVKTVAGKMILQGAVTADILCLCGEESTPRQERLSAPFSQILDGEEAAEATVKLAVTACYIEPLPSSYGVAGVHLEMHLSAQVLCRNTRDIAYMADAYSVRCPCTVRSETIPVLSAERETMLRETLRETIELTQTVSETVSAYVIAGVPGETESGMSLPVSIHILYKTEQGNLAGTSLRRSVPFAMDTPDGTLVSFGEARCGEIYLSPSGRSIEVRVPIEVCALLFDKKEITSLAAVELDTENPLAPRQSPSLTVVRFRENSVWSLAKKYGSTTERIESANPAPIRYDDLLLIPRAR